MNNSCVIILPNDLTEKAKKKLLKLKKRKKKHEKILVEEILPNKM